MEKYIENKEIQLIEAKTKKLDLENKCSKKEIMYEILINENEITEAKRVDDKLFLEYKFKAKRWKSEIRSYNEAVNHQKKMKIRLNDLVSKSFFVKMIKITEINGLRSEVSFFEDEISKLEKRIDVLTIELDNLVEQRKENTENLGIKVDVDINGLMKLLLDIKRKGISVGSLQEDILNLNRLIIINNNNVIEIEKDLNKEYSKDIKTEYKKIK